MPGARIEVKLGIRLGDEEFPVGLGGTIQGGIEKMVGKAYKVKFDDGRLADIHITTMNNNMYIFTESGERIDPKSLWKR
ncbi:MAG: hypothetical protein ACT4NX_06700 [Deltaproteobacteria bacterium]